ncbi:MAG: domain containing protein [Schlesneria sp.]|nr:domain containing protein [Schlesneria sp.]
MPSFSITPPKQVVLNSGRGDLVFGVTSLQARPIRGRVTPSSEGTTRATWLSVVGDLEYDVLPNQSQQVVIRVVIPPGTPAGRYGFRLDAVNVADPDDDFAQSDLVEFDVQATPSPVTATQWGAILAATLGSLAVLLLLSWQLWPRTGKVPNVIGKPISEATQMTRDAGFVPVEIEPKVTDKEPGTVIEQSPTASDTPVPVGTKVQLTTEASLVAVPNLVNQVIQDAAVTAILKDLGMQIAVEETRLEQGKPLGTILEQDPPFDAQRPTYVRRNLPLLVTIVGDGMELPNLVGKRFDDAVNTVVSSNLIVKGYGNDDPTSPEHNRVQPGEVYKQDPPWSTGKLVAKNSGVLLWIRPTRVPVPKLESLSYFNADNEAKKAGLAIEITNSPGAAIIHHFIFPDKVLSQSPMFGSPPIEVGAKIQVTVSWELTKERIDLHPARTDWLRKAYVRPQ